MARKVSLKTNNGFGWSFGTTGSKVVELETVHNFGWNFVKDAAPVNIEPPTISGTARVGSTLTANDGVWSEGGTPPSFTRQWKANGVDISGATGANYVPVVDQIGQTITVTVTATNEVGSSSATSSPTAGVVAALAAPVNTAVPVVTGTPTVGSVLTTTNGTWNGNPTPTYTRVWQRGTTPISGATGTTYTLVAADAGQTIRCVVTATNSQGNASANSANTAVVTQTPTNTVLPTITGTAQVGQTLTSTNGTWTGSPTPTFTYQWKADTVNISGATAATYLLTEAELDSVITVTVTGTNSAGNAAATSLGTTAVIAA